jgi:hypothetical protein
MKEKYKFLSFLLFFSPLLTKCSKYEKCETIPDSELFPCSKAKINIMLGGISSNVIFPNTQRIYIPAYNYPSLSSQFHIFGNSILVSGDSLIEKIGNSNSCCYFAEVVDRYPIEPVYKWSVIPSNLTAIAVFENVVQLSIDGKRIQNVDDIVWTWNSGMGTGSQVGGNVVIHHKDGRDVSNGQILSTVTKLDTNKLYYWGIWAWDDNGVNVTYSSRAIPFVVESIPKIQVKSIRQLEGSWKLQKAIDEQLGTDFTNNFPIQRFTGTVFCEDIYELRYNIEPSGFSGTISGNNYKNDFEIIGVRFFDLELISDCILIGKAELNGRIYEVRYY